MIRYDNHETIISWIDTIWLWQIIIIRYIVKIILTIEFRYPIFILLFDQWPEIHIEEQYSIWVQAWKSNTHINAASEVNWMKWHFTQSFPGQYSCRWLECDIKIKFHKSLVFQHKLYTFVSYKRMGTLVNIRNSTWFARIIGWLINRSLTKGKNCSFRLHYSR